MTLTKYISNILLGEGSEMLNNFVFVILPVLSITILMFSLRSIFENTLDSKLRKQ